MKKIKKLQKLTTLNYLHIKNLNLIQKHSNFYWKWNISYCYLNNYNIFLFKLNIFKINSLQINIFNYYYFKNIYFNLYLNILKSIYNTYILFLIALK